MTCHLTECLLSETSSQTWCCESGDFTQQVSQAHVLYHIQDSSVSPMLLVSPWAMTHRHTKPTSKICRGPDGCLLRSLPSPLFGCLWTGAQPSSQWPRSTTGTSLYFSFIKGNMNTEVCGNKTISLSLTTDGFRFVNRDGMCENIILLHVILWFLTILLAFDHFWSSFFDHFLIIFFHVMICFAKQPIKVYLLYTSTEMKSHRGAKKFRTAESKSGATFHWSATLMKLC